jgi:hypothetical protein
MSDPSAAKLLREAATRHFAEATESGKWDEQRQGQKAKSLRLLIGADVPAKESN